MSGSFVLPADPANAPGDFNNVRASIKTGDYHFPSLIEAETVFETVRTGIANEKDGILKNIISKILMNPADMLIPGVLCQNRTWADVRALFGGRQLVRPVLGIEDNVTDALMTALINSTMRGVDFDDFIDLIEFKGFNRIMTRLTAIKKLGPIACIQIALVGALRGTNPAKIGDFQVMVEQHEAGVAKNVVPMTISTLLQGNILAKSTKGAAANILSIGRISSAFPIEVAYALWKKGYSEKRYEGCPLPAWLQFPSAFTLDLPGMTPLAFTFQYVFSKAVKGTFNLNLHKQIRAKPVSDKIQAWETIKIGHEHNTISETLDFGSAEPAHNIYWTLFDQAYHDKKYKSFSKFDDVTDPGFLPKPNDSFDD